MDSPEIEYIIAEAIEKRPKVTTAPMNLYMYNNRVICGARIVMPADACFITHLTPQHLQNGFNDREWKLVVRKTKEISGIQVFANNNSPSAPMSGQNQSQSQAHCKKKFVERRREKRLQYQQSIWFGEDFNKRLYQGQMVDISSGGMAFNCDAAEKFACTGHRITTHFNVPHFDTNHSTDVLSFDRVGHICRITKQTENLHSLAIQFAEPLPFKPAEQDDDWTDNAKKQEPVAI